MQAMTELSQNPANFAKYQDNPKFAKIAEKLQRKFGGSPGMDGEGTGGSGSAPTSSSTVPEQPDID